MYSACFDSVEYRINLGTGCLHAWWLCRFVTYSIRGMQFMQWRWDLVLGESKSFLFFFHNTWNRHKACIFSFEAQQENQTDMKLEAVLLSRQWFAKAFVYQSVCRANYSPAYPRKLVWSFSVTKFHSKPKWMNKLELNWMRIGGFYEHINVIETWKKILWFFILFWRHKGQKTHNGKQYLQPNPGWHCRWLSPHL